MMARRNIPEPADSLQIRCAIYTRKSSEDGLQLEFNSLDAQREAGEAYVSSQRHEGWVCLPTLYDDGGFSGGNIERPGLQRLLHDIRDGKVDCVVVYKVDRLSRSLLDFSRIMETFENHKVSFVSVTQQFNTTHSMGRLTLNILLSFAQFEREIIGERIRDKLAAQRRKGKWTGGRPILGYDVDRSNASPKLVINAIEAPRVRQVFSWYLETRSLLEVQRLIESQSWTNKAWTTRAGRRAGGKAFDKNAVYAMLTNPLYVGRCVHGNKEYQGEHPPLIEESVFAEVATILRKNGRTGGQEARNKHRSLLRGIIRCKACGRAMVHTFTKRKQRMYRYYTCSRAVNSGHDQCPQPTISASTVEQEVLKHVRQLATDPQLRSGVLSQAETSLRQELSGFRSERSGLATDLRHSEAEILRLTSQGVASLNLNTLADLQRRSSDLQQRIGELDQQIQKRSSEHITQQEVDAALADFEGLWDAWTPREQTSLVRLVVSQVEIDSLHGNVSILLHDTAFRNLMTRTKGAKHAQN